MTTTVRALLISSLIEATFYHEQRTAETRLVMEKTVIIIGDRYIDMFIFVEHLILPGEKVTPVSTPLFRRRYINISTKKTLHFGRKKTYFFKHFRFSLEHLILSGVKRYHFSLEHLIFPGEAVFPKKIIEFPLIKPHSSRKSISGLFLEHLNFPASTPL